MLWKKTWWETRWILLIFIVLWVLVYFLAFGWDDYDAARWAARLQRNADLSESERQALNSYQGRTWVAWFKLVFSVLWADLAVVMGGFSLMIACPVGASQSAAGLFTFSLPVSRRKVLLSQAAGGFGEMSLIALIPSLFLPIMARLHGQWFSLRDALIYALLVIFGGAVFFFSSLLLTVILHNWLVAFLLVEVVLFALYLPFLHFRTRPWWNILGMMSGESYFYRGQIPWLGLSISLILSAVFMFTAVRIYERRDL